MDDIDLVKKLAEDYKRFGKATPDSTLITMAVEELARRKKVEAAALGKMHEAVEIAKLADVKCERLQMALMLVRDGYGSNHDSMFCRDVAATALLNREIDTDMVAALNQQKGPTDGN
jgi:hypothetical protein